MRLKFDYFVAGVKKKLSLAPYQTLTFDYY